MPPLLLSHARTHSCEHGIVDVEPPRRNTSGGRLLGTSRNSAVGCIVATSPRATHQCLPQLVVATVSWDLDAAQMVVDRQVREFLDLGTGGVALWARHSTLSALSEAGAQIVAIEHDRRQPLAPVIRATWLLQGTAFGLALVLR
ncbi:hypothetical protein ACFVYA_31020 [Amycolatopsis sp. NPDC058278]|uniref:hypothetical protein n=1 Tax=Amycolatopsis sp. NPDC058278 TaxID=3346417 RepID=UPI0036DD6648